MKTVLWDDIFQSLRLTGEGTRKFIHGQTSSDILNAKKNVPIITCWLTTTGKVRSILEVILDDNGADICSFSGDIQFLYEGFNKVIFPFDKVEINSINKIRRIQIMNYETSWKESKVIWLDTKSSLPQEFKNIETANFEQLKVWRILQGLPILNEELDADYNPLELGLYDLLDTQKGCYLGQESIARFIRSGVNKELRYWMSDNILKKGDKLILNSYINDIQKDHVTGIVTSSFQVNESHSIGFAIIKSKYLDQDLFFLKRNLVKVKINKNIGFKIKNN